MWGIVEQVIDNKIYVIFEGQENIILMKII